MARVAGTGRSEKSDTNATIKATPALGPSFIQGLLAYQLTLLSYFFLPEADGLSHTERTGNHIWLGGQRKEAEFNYLWITACRAMHVDGFVFREIVVPTMGKPQLEGMGLYPC